MAKNIVLLLFSCLFLANLQMPTAADSYLPLSCTNIITGYLRCASQTMQQPNQTIQMYGNMTTSLTNDLMNIFNTVTMMMNTLEQTFGTNMTTTISGIMNMLTISAMNNDNMTVSSNMTGIFGILDIMNQMGLMNMTNGTLMPPLMMSTLQQDQQMLAQLANMSNVNPNMTTLIGNIAQLLGNLMGNNSSQNFTVDLIATVSTMSNTMSMCSQMIMQMMNNMTGNLINGPINPQIANAFYAEANSYSNLISTIATIVNNTMISGQMGMRNCLTSHGIKLDNPSLYLFKNPNYTANLMQYLNQINRTYASMHVISVLNGSSIDPSMLISNLCSNFDWTLNGILTEYNQTQNCQAPQMQAQMQACLNYNLPTVAANNSNYLQVSNADFKNYLHCAALALPSTCPIVFQRQILLQMIFLNPMAIPNGNLDGFLNSLLTTQTQLTVKRTDAWLTGDPQLFAYKASTFQLCSFMNEVNCYVSNSTQVYCSGAQLPNSTSNATLVSQVRLNFQVAGSNTTVSIVFNATSFPSVFSNGASVINSSNGQVAISMTIFSTSRVIFDALTNTHYSISQAWNNYLGLNVRATDAYYTAASSGVLVYGCPAQYLQTWNATTSTMTGKRRRRQTNCVALCSTDANPTMCQQNCALVGPAGALSFSSDLSNSQTILVSSDVQTVTFQDTVNTISTNATTTPIMVTTKMTATTTIMTTTATTAAPTTSSNGITLNAGCLLWISATLIAVIF